MKWTKNQIKNLEILKNTASSGHIRLKALAVWNASRGKSFSDIAEFLGICRQSVSSWSKAYQEHGVSGWYHEPGQGRKARADIEEVITHIQKSPHDYGLHQSRWTLELLIATVPTLKNYTRSGVHRLLRRIEISYKRGQLHYRSPDPQFFEKKNRIEEAIDEMRANDDVLVVYQDECSLYRQPTQAWIWSWMGRYQPKMKFSHKSNTLVRVIGTLNMRTGEVYHEMCSRVSTSRFASFLRNVSRKYASYKKVYVVVDNWPVHFHEKVQKVLAKLENIVILTLPTYAPFLNYIEKVWKWLKQTIVHAHPWSDDFGEFKQQVRDALDRCNSDEINILRYVGYQS